VDVEPWNFTRPIVTDRLVLRPMTPDDTDDVHAWMSDAEVTRYLLHGPRDRDDVATRVLDYSKATTLAAVGDYIQPAVELPGHGVIGGMYFTITSTDDLTGEIGWAFRRAFHGKGYALEAARAVLDLALREPELGGVGLHRVVAELDPRNAASIALCLRLGMREEAHLVENIMVKGEWADTGVYAILQREWLAP
jgi:RimJ/RimL family protein N-acetyltransferase